MSRAIRRGRNRALGEEGSAVVEFTLVSILVVFLVTGVFQLALTLHVRNTLLSCAAEGARVAAAQDRTLADGRERAETMSRDAFGGYPATATAQIVMIDGAPAVAMTISAPVPVVGMWGFGTMTVTARAFEEVDRG